MQTKTSRQQSSQTEQRAVQAQPGLAGHKPNPLGNAGVLLSLQRSHGNRYVQRLLDTALIQRSCSCSTCADCGENVETEAPDRPALQRKSSNLPASLQAKLTVSQPGDPYEQEADRVAENVMRMPEEAAQPVGHASLSIQRVQAGNGEELEGEQLVNGVISSPGQPLDSATRGFFEPRFGHDFSHVRIHTDNRAAESARAVSARAYTVGEHVVFAAQQFSPDSTEGRRLLAHELTHVVQQGGADSGVVPEEGSETDDSGLRTREMASSDQAVIFREAPPKLRSGPMLQRADCPCCANGISISNINQFDTPQKMGHSYDVDMDLTYPADGPQGRCTLEWWEKTNVPYTAGMSPDTWTNMFALVPTSPTFQPWRDRAEACGSSSPVKITDPPALGKTAGRTVTRTLEFRIVINSMPATSNGGCSSASKQVTAKQVLKMTGGVPDWAGSSFTTP